MTRRSIFTQAQLDALTAAIATGTRRVQYADRMTEYQSIEEMLKLRDRMMRELDESDPTSVGVVTSRPSVYMRR